MYGINPAAAAFGLTATPPLINVLTYVVHIIAIGSCSNILNAEAGIFLNSVPTVDKFESTVRDSAAVNVCCSRHIWILS